MPIELLPPKTPDNCTNCPLATNPERIQVVHSRIPKGCKILFIAEAPGRTEAEKGEPLIGAAGQILMSALQEIGLSRDEVGLANIAACRPPGNRVPTSIEADACQPFLDEEIKQANPEVIVLLGSTPLKRFLPEESGIMKARGKVHGILGPDFSGKIIPTYHPAFLLPNRQPEKKPEFIEDLKLAKREAGYEDKSKEKSTDTSYYVVRDRTQFDWLISQLHENDLWACDTETTGFDFRNDKIFIITFSWKAKTAVLVDFRLIDSFKEYAWTKIKEVLENKSKKVFQNGSFDIEFFMANDIYVTNYYRDTILMDYLLDENELHGLEVLASRYTDMGGYDLPLEVYVKEHKIENYAAIPPEIIHPYACADADVTLRCYQTMVPKIEEQGLGTIMNMIMQFQKLLIVTEFNGVTIDIDHLNKMTKEYEKKIKDELKEVFKSSEVQLYVEKRKKDFLVKYDEKFESNPKYYLKRYGNKDEYLTTMMTKYPKELEFNPNSSKQKKELLIDQMKLPIIKYTKDSKTHKPTKNPCLDADVLEEYSKKNKVCKHLSNVVSFTHLKSTFLDGMREKLDENNKIHTDYFLFSTDTGRPSSASPNLNNIPRTSTAGGIKDIFRSDVGNYWLMETDGSQMEFRTWINYSRDPQALADLEAGYDIHKLMAAVGKGVVLPKGNISRELYEAIIKGITKDERQDAKLVVFGVMYGRGAKSVAEQLGIPVITAQRIIDQFFARYRQAQKYLQSCIGNARKLGYVTNLFGRRRRLANINSKFDDERSTAERQSQNSPIQSGASDIVLLAGTRIANQLWSKGMKTRLVLTVYDSLVYNIPEDELEFVVPLVYTEMTKKFRSDIIVPFDCEVKVGKNWGSLIEVKPLENWKLQFDKIKSELKSKGVEIGS